MNTTIYCTAPRKGGLSFYLEADGQRFFLYHTPKFSMRVFKEYNGGKHIDMVFRGSRAYNSQNTRERLIRTLAYIEKEQNISVLNKTERAKQRSPRRKRTKDFDEELYI